MPIITERAFIEKDRFFTRQKMSDLEKDDWIKNKFGVPIPEIPINELTDEEKAENIALDVLQELENGNLEYDDFKELEEDALRALQLCGNSLLAIEAFSKTCLNLVKCEKAVDKGIEIGSVLFGGEFEKENEGHFWGLVRTRPYLRLLASKAQILEEKKRKKEALEVYRLILRLNHNDNMGSRFELQRLYLEFKQYDLFMDVIDDFEEEFEFSIQSLYNYALYLFITLGECDESDDALSEAISFNPFVLPYLKGKKLAQTYISRYTPKGEDGAQLYVQDNLYLWRRQVGIQNWLRQFEE
jgi:tetratricopeptide (TPR) repeat protein